jgi:hypothetical protein
MLSRSSINLSRRGESLDLQIPHSGSREKEVTTPQTRDRSKMATLRKTSTSHNLRRVMRSRIRTWESGVNIIKSLGKTVVGKSACGQVDRPLELDLNPR